MNGPLDGVHAFLDVRTGSGEDVTADLEETLVSLGGVRCKSVSNATTHVVFKHGKQATLIKFATISSVRQLHLVNLLWISKSGEAGVRLPESNFPVSGESLNTKRLMRSPGMSPQLTSTKTRRPPARAIDACLDHAPLESPTATTFDAGRDVLQSGIDSPGGIIMPSHEKSAAAKIKAQKAPTDTKLKRASATSSKITSKQRSRKLHGDAQATTTLSPPYRTLSSKQREAEGLDGLLAVTAPLFDRSNKSDADKKRKSRSDGPVICVTGCDSSTVDCLVAAIAHIGGHLVEEVLNATHVISAGRRTLKVLEAITAGLWVLDPAWALASIEAEQWLPEQDYELSSRFPGARVAREARAAEMPASCKRFRLQLFDGVGTIAIQDGSKEGLAGLLTSCGGRLTSSSAERADLRIVPDCDIGIQASDDVSEQWVYESISNGVAQPR